MSEGWFWLLMIFFLAYFPAIGGFLAFSRHSGVLLVIAAFVPFVLHMGGFHGPEPSSFRVVFLWGWFENIGLNWQFVVVSPITRSILSFPSGTLAMFLLLAGGVLGLIGRNQKFFKIGGILGVVATTLMLLGWLGSSDRWMLFDVYSNGFSTVSFGFFAAVIGSYIMLRTTRYDVLVMRKDVDGAVKGLEDKSPGVRLASAEALWEIGDKRTVEPLNKALGDEDSKIRTEAARALGEIGGKQAVEPLIKALGDKSSVVRQHVARALGKIGDKQAVEPLIEALKGKFEAKLRIEAAKALGVIGDPRAVEALEKALEDEENKVRKKAKTALNKIRRKSKEEKRRR